MVTRSLNTEKTKVVATKHSVQCIDAVDAATVIQAVMDKEFIKGNGELWAWVDFNDAVDSKGKTLEGDTWYKIDREIGVLEKVSKEDIEKVAWHERLYVHTGAIHAIENRTSPVIYIDPGLGIIFGEYYKDGSLSIVQVKKGQANQNEMLRE